MMTDSLDGSGPWPTCKKRPRLLGAGRKQAPLGPDGDAKSEGNELLLALGHFAPLSRGSRPLCHSRAEDCFLCHL